MSETENEKAVTVESTNEEILSKEFEKTDSSKSFWRDKRLMIGVSIFSFLLLGAAIFWAWQRNRSDSGQVMPAPRTINVGIEEGNGETSALAADETLTVPPEQIEQLKIETKTVGETFSGEISGATSTGVVQSNAYAETPVFSLVGGVVRSVSAQLGEYVRQGQPIAVVNSDELAQTQSSFLSMIAEADEARKRYRRSLELTNVSPETNTEFDRAEADVKIAEAEHAEHLSHFRRTAKLLEIGAVSREEFEMVKAKHETAAAKLEEAQSRLERAKQLLKINPERKNEIDRSLAQLQTAEAKAGAERQKLLILGMSPQQVNQIQTSRRISSVLSITSPVSGTITAREVNSGEIIPANKELFKVTNLGTVWVIAEVYEKDLAQIRVGSGASITSDAYPGKVFRGQVSYIDPNVKQETRTAQVRVEVENPGQIFKIGMYVNVAFGSLGMSERTAPMVPAAAVQNINNRNFVFLLTDKPGVFIMRQIRLGAENGDGFVVLEGINVGDKVVTNRSFLLRAEWLKRNSGK